MIPPHLDLRPLAPNEFDAAMDLVRCCYGEAAEPPAWWRWRHFDGFLDNPVILGAVHGNRVVALRPLTYFPFSVAGRQTRGGVFSAVMVHPEYRRQGLFSALVEVGLAEAWKNDASFVVTMPNDLSARGFRKLGWIDPGERTLLAIVLDAAAVLRTQIGSSWIARLFSALAHPVLTHRCRVEIEPQSVITEVDSIPADADSLDDRVCERHTGIRMCRGHRWWNWRFRENPWVRYRRFEARCPDNDLTGILATALEQRSGLTVGYVADVMAENPRYERELILQAITALKGDGAHIVLTVLSDSALIKRFRGLAFRPVPNFFSPKRFRTMYVTNPKHHGLSTQLSDITSWSQTLGDWDGI